MRLIDADAKELNQRINTNFGAVTRFIIKNILKDAPTIEAEPVRHGCWIDRYGGKYVNPLYECSECKKKALYKIEVDVLGKEQIVQALSDVCHNCGAKMDKEEA